MNAPIVAASGRTSDDTPGDVLARLLIIVGRTPRHALVAEPVSRALLVDTASEISRLRAENAQLMAQLNNGDQPL